MRSASTEQSEIAAATAKRRTFAIISHPDAGKTTLTEKLLLYSGLIRTAGMVRGRKGGKTAASDWMGMEQERGISITASAMQFPYKDAVINLLDTPGHQDFSEDTYRTLTAADSAIMVIDAAKGVEAQTRKLFAVCRLRRIPVLTFVNKMDLPGRPPLDLMTEVEEALTIHASAVNWPIGSGSDFAGIVTRDDHRVALFSKTAHGGATKVDVQTMDLADLSASGRVVPDVMSQVEHDLELLAIAGNPFAHDRFLDGDVTPVFFGSALTNFGVESFLDTFVRLAPSPAARPADGDDGGELAIDPIRIDTRNRSLLRLSSANSSSNTWPTVAVFFRMGAPQPIRLPAPLCSRSLETIARLCQPRPTSPAGSATLTSKRKSLPSRPA